TLPGHRVRYRALAFRRAEIGAAGCWMPVARRSRTSTRNLGAPQPVSVQVAAPGMDILTGQLAELRQGIAKLLVLGVDDGVGAIGRDDSPAPTTLLNPAMMLKWIDR